MRFFVPLAGAALLLAGCAGRPLGPAQTGIYVAAPVATTPDLRGAPPADYRIGPLDQIRIDVFQEPELSLEDLPVDTNGNINMPLAGQINAQGLTAAELSASISQKLVRYLRNPHVSVNVTKFTSQRITVGGAVEKAGVLEQSGRTTLLDAISLAGGLSSLGREDEIIVLRKGPGDLRQIARFDLRPIQAGQAPDPVLQTGDVVIVGTSNARRTLGYAVAFVPAVVGVFATVLNNIRF